MGDEAPKLPGGSSLRSNAKLFVRPSCVLANAVGHCVAAGRRRRVHRQTAVTSMKETTIKPNPAKDIKEYESPVF